MTSTALRRNFFFELFEVPQGAGTGFFWDDAGHVVTNFHVIEGANSFTVTMADRSEWVVKECLFYRCDLTAGADDGSEDDHHAQWVPVATATGLLSEAASAWAVGIVAGDVAPDGGERG